MPAYRILFLNYLLREQLLKFCNVNKKAPLGHRFNNVIFSKPPPPPKKKEQGYYLCKRQYENNIPATKFHVGLNILIYFTLVPT